jgi:lysyl-tRNA synthetase class 1
MHWADVVARDLRAMGDEHTIATGITPSGEIHIGNMREILTADAIARALEDLDVKARLIYIGDTFDPLRKVYSFLDASYKEHVGKPLYEIPCPCAPHARKHEHYAEHFLLPFLEAVEKLGVELEIKLMHEVYQSGAYAEQIKIVLEHKDTIRALLERISKREIPGDWYPYNPKCESCMKLTTTRVTQFKYPFADYLCKCGHEGKADIRKADGKLPWRVDWAARWHHFKVSCEPFGKDHAAAGGSYDTGKAIVREVFGIDAPYPVVYEWIQLKGKGAMSSSKGIVVSANDMLRMIPPEAFRFIIIRQNPNTHIDFDPGKGILNLMAEFDRYERIYYGTEEAVDEEEHARTYELSQIMPPPEGIPLQIPYGHLVTLAQLQDSWEGIREILQRTELIKELDEPDEARLKHRIECIRFWLRTYAPEYIKFSVQEKVKPECIAQLTGEQKTTLAKLAEHFLEIEWTPENIHNGIYAVSQKLSVNPKSTFQAIYLLILGQPRGPRIGYFLSSLDRNFVIDRLTLKG